MLLELTFSMFLMTFFYGLKIGRQGHFVGNNNDIYRFSSDIVC